MKPLLLGSALALLPALALAQVPGQSATPPGGDGTFAAPGAIAGPLDSSGAVPSSVRTTFGNSNNNYPFSAGIMRYQQVFRGSELPAARPIQVLGLRQDDAFSGYKGYSIDVEIKVGYTTFDETTLTNTFASNFNSGTPMTVLPRTNFTLPDMPNSPPSDPGVFFAQIPFKTPFVWVQQPNRNLLIEVVIHGNGNGNSSFTYPLDAQSATTTTRLYASGSATATTGTLGQGYGLAMNFQQKILQFGSYVPYGTGCPGTGGGRTCASLNATETSNRTTTLANAQFCLEVTAPSPLVVTGFELLSRATTPLTLQTHLYLADSSGTKPAATPIRTGATMSVGTSSAWHSTTFSGAPLVINQGQKFYLAFTSQSGLYPVSSNGSNGTHFWNGPPNWSGPWNTQPWAWKVLCAGAGNATPRLSNTGLPTVGSSYSADLSMAVGNSAAVLWTGFTKLSIDLTAAGAPNCSLLTTPDFGLAVPTGNGNASVPFPLPNVPAFVGLKYFQQFMVLDGQANTLGLVFTNGAEATVGG